MILVIVVEPEPEQGRGYVNQRKVGSVGWIWSASRRNRGCPHHVPHS